MGRTQDSGVKLEDVQLTQRWVAAFRALRLEDENAWRMFPDDASHHVAAAVTFIHIACQHDDDMVRRAWRSFPNFTTDALVRLANRLRVEVVKRRLD